jgi:peroxiredoxin
MRTFSLAVLVACCAVLTLHRVSLAAADAALDKRVESFSLRDFHGKLHTRAQYADKKALVLVTLGTDCPLARLYAPRLAELEREFAERGVAFLGIDANAHDTPTKLARFAETYKVGFPLLKDAGNALADELGATRTPEAFVLDPAGAVRYHGRIDDQFSVGVQRGKADRRDLAAALAELVDGKAVTHPSTPFTGCLIARVRKIEPKGDINYSSHVAAIFNRRCVECHRAGELAPFALTSYDEVVDWAENIREVVSENRMPPWLADPQYGKFSNDCSLSADEKRTILSWIDDGCPRGDEADLPTPPTFVTGWRMGEPNVVYKMDQAFEVAAEGTVDYQYFVVEPELKEDLWIASAEARPGNVSVVHHVVLFAVGPGIKVDHLEEVQAVGKMIAIYAPGMNPWTYPEGTAVKVEKGSSFVIQTHYTPNGTRQMDRSYVGLRLADPAKVKRRANYGMAVNPNILIPPGADDVEIKSGTRFARDTLLLNLFPHMHFRGKSFRFEAEYADGRREVLLDVPRYDFNWQLRYDLAEPKFLPKGTRLLCTAHYDNSASNPWNPDPTATVRFGLQSWEEMMVGYYTTMPAAERIAATDKPTGAGE